MVVPTAAAGSAAPFRVFTLILCWLPVEPWSRWSRDTKVHLYADGQQLWQRLLDRTTRHGIL